MFLSLIITQGSNYHIINMLYIYIYLYKDLIGVESTWNEIKEAVKSTPTMVFSVIGDSENFISKPWQTNVFQTALIEAARSGGGISIYDFYNTTLYCLHVVNKLIHIKVEFVHGYNNDKNRLSFYILNFIK